MLKGLNVSGADGFDCRRCADWVLEAALGRGLGDGREVGIGNLVISSTSTRGLQGLIRRTSWDVCWVLGVFRGGFGIGIRWDLLIRTYLWRLDGKVDRYRGMYFKTDVKSLHRDCMYPVLNRLSFVMPCVVFCQSWLMRCYYMWCLISCT